MRSIALSRSSTSSSDGGANSLTPSHKRLTRRRGACSNCRHRKIKCDGVTPICGPCQSVNGGDEDCEYAAVGMGQIQVLEDNILRLEEKIKELEDPTFSSGESIQLRQPYSSSSRASVTSDRSTSEPPRHITGSLYSAFFQHSQDVGFFLHEASFKSSCRSPEPLGSPLRPTPSLQHAVLLWGYHLLAPQTDSPEKQACLSACVAQLPRDLAGMHPRRVVHAIQTMVLLSFFYRSAANHVQGAYYANAAIALSVSTGMHRNRFPPGHANAESGLEAPKDAVEAGERVNAFWMCIVVEAEFLLYGLPSQPSAVYYSQVETPFPMSDEEYSKGMLPYNNAGTKTVLAFLDGTTSSDERNLLAYHAKASILFEQACAHARIITTGQITRVFSTLVSLEFRLSAFRQNLALVPAQIQARSARFIVSEVLANAATIRLHSTSGEMSPHSRGKALGSALDIVRAVPKRGLGGLRCPNPILGLVWNIAASALVICLRDAQARGEPLASAHPAEVRMLLDGIVRTMQGFSARSPVFRMYAQHLQAELFQL